MAPFEKSRLSLLKPTAPTDSSRYLKAPKPTRHTFQRKTKKKQISYFWKSSFPINCDMFLCVRTGRGAGNATCGFGKGPLTWGGGDLSDVLTLLQRRRSEPSVQVGGLRPPFDVAGLQWLCTLLPLSKMAKNEQAGKGKKVAKKPAPI